MKDTLTQRPQVSKPQHLCSGRLVVLQPMVTTDSTGHQRRERFHVIALACIPVVKSRNGCGAGALAVATDSSRPRHVGAVSKLPAGRLVFTAASPFCSFYWKEVEVQKVFLR